MSEPAQVFCLADFIAEEMEMRQWTTSDVARRMGPPNHYVRNKLMLDLVMAVSPVRDNMLVGEDTFNGLAAAFGVSAEYFRNLHNQWKKCPDRRSPFECPEHLFGTDIRFTENDQD